MYQLRPRTVRMRDAVVLAERDGGKCGVRFLLEWLITA